jgi:hypothetical protein
MPYKASLPDTLEAVRCVIVPGLAGTADVMFTTTTVSQQEADIGAQRVLIVTP